MPRDVASDVDDIRPAERFRYDKPELGRPKALRKLASTDIAVAAVQVVRRGGENNLHSHAHTDGFWFVLSGGARFYTTDDEVIAELGPNEGVVIPRNYPYWFEAFGPEDLELFQFEAHDRPRKSHEQMNFDRVDHRPDIRAPEGGKPV